MSLRDAGRMVSELKFKSLRIENPSRIAVEDSGGRPVGEILN